MSDNERIIKANGVDLCIETFGDERDKAHGATLLVHGASASMLWWPSELCERLAAAGRYVIRFDNRDTGRSTSYPAGQPGYSLRDMAEDAVGILDALGIERAHLIGQSMAGGIVLVAAQEHPDRVASLTLIATTSGAAGLSPIGHGLTGDRAPAPDPERDGTEALVEHIVGTVRTYSGPSRFFNEEATRNLVRQDVERTADIPATLVNHYVIDTSGVRPDFGKLDVPTLVVHGSQDPLFAPDHGEYLRDAIPGARLLVLEGAGHELPEQLWEEFEKHLPH